MAKDVFSVPIFFIVFREALEASIIISVLLALVEQIAHTPISRNSSTPAVTKVEDHNGTQKEDSEHSIPHLTSDDQETAALIKRMRIQVIIGAATGLFISLAIGAAFLAVWFTQTNDIFGANEEIWEGVFNLVASLIIFPMALTMLRVDKAKSKWRVKLQKAFLEEQNSGAPTSRFAQYNIFRRHKNEDLTSRGSRWTLFLLPFFTVLREGLEAVVFIGGVSLGQEATSIPLAAIVGLLCGFIIGYIIYASSSRTALHIFLIISTNFLLLIGAGLFSKSVGNFERHQFNKII
ncbi:high-affinity iron permease [Tulasnella sp. 419]|nr:high-affinity iron permease [Tulasnella sp. 419]